MSESPWPPRSAAFRPMPIRSGRAPPRRSTTEAAAPNLPDRSDFPDRSNAPRKVLVVAVLPPEVREIDVCGHVGRLLRRRPIREVVDNAGVVKVAGAGSPEVRVHQRQLVSRRQEPA